MSFYWREKIVQQFLKLSLQMGNLITHLHNCREICLVLRLRNSKVINKSFESNNRINELTREIDEKMAS